MRWAECKNCIKNTGVLKMLVRVQKQNNLTKLPQFGVRVCLCDGVFFSRNLFPFIHKYILQQIDCSCDSTWKFRMWSKCLHLIWWVILHSFVFLGGDLICWNGCLYQRHTVSSFYHIALRGLCLVLAFRCFRSLNCLIFGYVFLFFFIDMSKDCYLYAHFSL